MNKKPGKWCPQCGTIHQGSCPKRAWVASKPKLSGRGGRPWQRLRKAVFERDNFLCQECKRQGLIKAVELHGTNTGICDHIKPKFEGGTDDMENLQTLCKQCNDYKTARESLRGRGA